MLSIHGGVGSLPLPRAEDASHCISALDMELQSMEKSETSGTCVISRRWKLFVNEKDLVVSQMDGEHFYALPTLARDLGCFFENILYQRQHSTE